MPPPPIQVSNAASPSSQMFLKPSRRSISTLWILLTVLFLQTMSVKLMSLPLNRVIELRYCQNYYAEHNPGLIGPDGSVKEKLCKIDAVQQRLAWTQGMVETGHVVCDLLVTLPLGALSDKGHRRLVLTLNVTGLAAMYLWIVLVGYLSNVFPVKAMIAGPLFSLLGGGECVFMSTVAAVVTEIAPEESRRASYFAYISSVTYVIALLSPSISAFTMTWNIWLPFWLGLTMLGLAVPTIGLLSRMPGQELLHSHGNNSEVESLLSRDSLNFKPDNPRSSHQEFISRIHDALTDLYHRATQRRNFRILLAVFLFASLASSNTPILPQYISARYGWTFAQAGYLLSVKAFVNMILLTIIVPWTIKAVLKSSAISGVAMNLYAARISIAVSVIGAICIATSTRVWILITSLIIYAVGSALPVFTLSLVKCSAVAGHDQEANAKDYSIVMLARTVGSLIGLPLMTVAWAKGIGIGGAGFGLPYWLSAGFYTCAFWFARRLDLVEEADRDH